MSTILSLKIKHAIRTLSRTLSEIANDQPESIQERIFNMRLAIGIVVIPFYREFGGRPTWEDLDMKNPKLVRQKRTKTKKENA